MDKLSNRTKIAIAVIGLAIMVGGVKVISDQAIEPLAAQLIYEGKWDQYQDLRGFYWHSPPPQIVSDRVRTGTHALRSFLEWPNAGEWDRAEIFVGLDNDAPPDQTGAIQLEYGKRYWFSISIFVSEDLPIIDDPPRLTDVLIQMHGKRDKDDGVVVENPRNPQLTLEVDSGNDVFRIYTRGDDRRITPINKSYQFSHSFELPLIKGRWVDWVFEMLLSYNDDGELRIWQDGELVYEGFHKNTWNDDRGPHIAFGIYSWWIDNNYGIDTYREYWHDHFKLAVGENGYNVVSPDPIIEPTDTPLPITPMLTASPTFTVTSTMTPSPTFTPTPTMTPTPEHSHQDIYERLDVIETQQANLLELNTINANRITWIEMLLREIASLIDLRLGE